MAKSKKVDKKAFDGNFKASAGNTIKPIRTEPSIPKYLYNLDKERYKDQYKKRKIKKA